MRDDLNHNEIKTLEFALNFLNQNYGVEPEESKVQQAIHNTLITNETLNVAQWWTVLELAAMTIDFQLETLSIPVNDLLSLPKSSFPLFTRVEAHKREWLSIQVSKKNRLRVLDIQEKKQEWLTADQLATKLHLWKRSKKVKWLSVATMNQNKKQQNSPNQLWKRLFPFLMEHIPHRTKSTQPSEITTSSSKHYSKTDN